MAATVFKPFEKEFWNLPIYPDCVHISSEGYIAAMTSCSIHVMVPVLDMSAEFEYAWVYLDEGKKPKPVNLTAMPGYPEGGLNKAGEEDLFQKWLVEYGAGENVSVAMKKIAWSSQLYGGSLLAVLLDNGKLFLFELNSSSQQVCEVFGRHSFDMTGLRLVLEFPAQYSAWKLHNPDVMNDEIIDQVDTFAWASDSMPSSSSSSIIAIASRNKVSLWAVSINNKTALYTMDLLSYTKLSPEERITCLLISSSPSTNNSNEFSLSIAGTSGSVHEYRVEDASKWRLINKQLLLATCQSAVFALPRDITGYSTPVALQTLHSEPITSVAWLTSSQDHYCFLTSSCDGVIRSWGYTAGNEIRSSIVYRSKYPIMGLCTDPCKCLTFFVEIIPADHINSSEVQTNNYLRYPHCKMSCFAFPLSDSLDASEIPVPSIEAIYNAITNICQHSPEQLNISLSFLLILVIIYISGLKIDSPFGLAADRRRGNTAEGDGNDRPKERLNLVKIAQHLSSKMYPPIDSRIESFLDTLEDFYLGSPTLSWPNVWRYRITHLLTNGLATYFGVPLSPKRRNIVFSLRMDILLDSFRRIASRLSSSSYFSEQRTQSADEQKFFFMLMKFLSSDAAAREDSLYRSLEKYIHSSPASESTTNEFCYVCGSSLPFDTEQLVYCKAECLQCRTILDRCCSSLRLISPHQLNDIYSCRSCGSFIFRCRGATQSIFSSLSLLCADSCCPFCLVAVRPLY